MRNDAAVCCCLSIRVFSLLGHLSGSGNDLCMRADDLVGTPPICSVTGLLKVSAKLCFRHRHVHRLSHRVASLSVDKGNKVVYPHWYLFCVLCCCVWKYWKQQHFRRSTYQERYLATENSPSWKWWAMGQWQISTGEYHYNKYLFIVYCFCLSYRSYAGELGPKHWPNSRYEYVMKLKQAALNFARKRWADYILVHNRIILLVTAVQDSYQHLTWFIWWNAFLFLLLICHPLSRWKKKDTTASLRLFPPSLCFSTPTPTISSPTLKPSTWWSRRTSRSSLPCWIRRGPTRTTGVVSLRRWASGW